MAALAEGRATGGPEMEKLTPGLFGELERALGWNNIDMTIGGKSPNGSLVSSPSSPLGGSGDDTSEGKIVWFHELGEPKEREYLIEKIGVKGYPIVAFGAGARLSPSPCSPPGSRSPVLRG